MEAPVTVTALADNYAPDLRSAATVQLFADNQFGYRPQFTDNWNMRAAYDSRSLAPYVGVRANAGDCIEWNAVLPEDASYKAFRQVIMGDGKPYADTPGNHDLTTYNAAASFPYQRTTADGIVEKWARTADEWARDVPGRGTANQVVTNGQIAVVTLSPDIWAYRHTTTTPGYAPPDPLTAAHLAWLDTQLTQLGSTPTWIVTHAPPQNQFATGTTLPAAEFVQPWDQIGVVIDAHPNVIGWMSGHWHIGANHADTIRKIQCGGRQILGINSPSSQGIRGAWTAGQQQYGDGTLGPECSKSMFVAYDGTDVTVRWRNHNNATWVQPQGGKYRRFAA